MEHIYCYRIKELCINLVIETSLYYDARSEKHQVHHFSSFPRHIFEWPARCYFWWKLRHDLGDISQLTGLMYW